MAEINKFESADDDRCRPEIKQSIASLCEPSELVINQNSVISCGIIHPAFK